MLLSALRSIPMRALSFMLKVSVLCALGWISKDDLFQIQKSIHKIITMDGEGDSDSESVWTVISDAEGEGPAVGCAEKPSRGKTRRSCRHLRKTRLGTNQWQKKVTCVDCGVVLRKEPTSLAMARSHK